MPLALAQTHAWRLAQTLMACITLFQIDNHSFGVVESREFDGDADSIISEYDPFAP